jgi:hypothetical protein
MPIHGSDPDDGGGRPTRVPSDGTPPQASPQGIGVGATLGRGPRPCDFRPVPLSVLCEQIRRGLVPLSGAQVSLEGEQKCATCRLGIHLLLNCPDRDGHKPASDRESVL